MTLDKLLEVLKSWWCYWRSKRAAKEVGSEMATSYIPTIVRQTGKLFNDEHQKIATSMFEYFKRNIAEGDLEYDYDARGRRYDKFVIFQSI